MQSINQHRDVPIHCTVNLNDQVVGFLNQTSVLQDYDPANMVYFVNIVNFFLQQFTNRIVMYISMFIKVI